MAPPPSDSGHNGRSSPQQELRALHPTFMDALIADARIAAAYRGERAEYRSRLDALLQALRLMLVTDSFLGQAAYRAKARMEALGIPVLPWIAHRVAMMTAQISIASSAVIHPGVFIAHGQVVIEGITVVHTGAVISPWVTLGLLGPSLQGPTIGAGTRVGAAAQILGPVKIGKACRVGANSVVLEDVPDRATVVGMPAKTTEV